MDMFDWLFRIEQEKEKGLTQAEIGGRIGWSRTKIADYIKLLSSIVAQVLELAKQHQKGRASCDDASATFDFTEGWFRTSGLYNLCPDYQQQFMEEFKKRKFKWSKEKVQRF